MKTTRLVTLVVTLAVAAFPAAAHSESGKAVAGPNGGRVLKSVQPPAEFFVTADRKVQITFLGTDGKAIAPAEQSVTVICGERTSPTRLSFAKSGDSLLSAESLPAGNDFPTLVQIKTTPDAKATVEKFNLNLSNCPGCQLPEYACTCAH